MEFRAQQRQHKGKDQSAAYLVVVAAKQITVKGVFGCKHPVGEDNHDQQVGIHATGKHKGKGLDHHLWLFPIVEYHDEQSHFYGTVDGQFDVCTVHHGEPDEQYQIDDGAGVKIIDDGFSERHDGEYGKTQHTYTEHKIGKQLQKMECSEAYADIQYQKCQHTHLQEWQFL